MAQRHDHDHERKLRPKRAGEPAPGFLGDMQVRRSGRRRKLRPALNASGNGHQMSRITTITVVICIMRRALPLDSGMPLILLHQKYTVTATLKKPENPFGL